MKFTIVVVMLALAIGVQASPLGWAEHGYDAYSGAYEDGSYHDDGYSHGPVYTPGIVLSQGHDSGYHGGYYDGHSASADYGHGHGHDAHYVAKTLGSVHTAPLIGHKESVSSVNVAPAPGGHHY